MKINIFQKSYNHDIISEEDALKIYRETKEYLKSKPGTLSPHKTLNWHTLFEYDPEREYLSMTHVELGELNSFSMHLSDLKRLLEYLESENVKKMITSNQI